MVSEEKQLLATAISGVAALCLMLAGLFVIGCGRPSPVLRADPNPVPGGTEMGKTTITWQTGSEAVADIYYVRGKEEKLFASGPKGSKEAMFIRPGSNEFRLYNQGQKKLVAQLIVTMPASAAAASSTPATPAESASP